MAKVRFVAETGVFKRCRRCKVTKDTSEFHRYARNRDGLQPYCRHCKRDIDKIRGAITGATKRRRKVIGCGFTNI